MGLEPRAYWSYEIGHILSLAPGEVDDLTPFDFLGALELFDAKYRSSD